MGHPKTPDPTKSSWYIAVTLAVAILPIAGGAAGWLYAQHKDKAEKTELVQAGEARLLNENLVPIQTALKENLNTYELLKKYEVPNFGILESYVIKAREVGVDNVTLEYNQIGALVERNSKIVAWLESYKSHELTKNFSEQSDLFLTHANNYSVRFQSLNSVAKTGQALPRAQVFPTKFSAAIDEEIRARRALAGLDK